MKVVILAGGMGSRISEESIIKPKPLIEIDEKPLIVHCIDELKRNGIGIFIEFRCPGGSYSETADSISQLFKMPTTKYLMGVCLGSLEKDKETDLLSHLQKLIKYHSKETNNVKKYEMEKEEIQRLKDILSHTLKTSDLEEMVRGLSPEK